MPAPSQGAVAYIRVSRGLPQIYPDTQYVEQRGGRYGSTIAEPISRGTYGLADEGAYFTAQNPTPGTGVAHALTTAFSNTAALFSLFNKSPIGGKRIYLDYFRLIVTGTAPATSLFEDFVVDVDIANRAPTANNVAIIPVNPNGDDGTQSICALQAFNAGSLTVPASVSTTRRVARFRANTGQVITGDSYIVQFGAVDMAAVRPPLTAVRATDNGSILAQGPPIIIGPQQYGTIYRWSAGEATNAPNFEYELGWWER